MSNLVLGLRGLVAGGIAILLSFFLIGSAGSIFFFSDSAWSGTGLPLWIVATPALAELALAGALWIPYLHRLAALVVVVDAGMQWLVNVRTGHPTMAAMHAVVGVMALFVSALWTSRPIATGPRALA